MDIITQFGSWIYVLAGFILLSLLLLVLWYRVQLNAKQIERELKILEAQYQDKVLESHRVFMQKQEGYISEKLKELEKKERGLSEALNSLEEENIKKLHTLLERFEKKIVHLQEENEKENEKRIQAIQDKYEKKLNELKEEKEKETEALKKERRKILAELEEYQQDLAQKSKDEMEKIRENYEKQMQNLQSENAKLLDEMNRMLDIKKKATQPPPPLPKQYVRPAPPPTRFSDETLAEIEKQIQTTSEEMEKLKEQFSTMQNKSKLEFEIAQHEIEEIKMKIRHGEMKG